MKDFEETKGLDHSALTTLLANGDARDRLLAIWALALRSTAAVSMADQLHAEPDAGVRRALAVVLAANGELDLVVAMSRHDPSPHVRASAVQIVVRFAIAGRVPWSLVAERFKDDVPVRASVASQIDATAPGDIRALVVAALADRDESVRREAFESCAKFAKAGLLSRDTLSDALSDMRPGECENALAVWLAIEDLDVLAHTLVTASVFVRKTAVRLRPELLPNYLADYTELSDELVKELRHAGTFSFDKVAIEWVIAFATQNPWDQFAIGELLSRLQRLMTLPAPLRPLLQRFEQAFAAARAPSESSELALVADDDDYEAERMAELALHDAALRVELSRLFGRKD